MRPIDADALMEQVCLEGDCTQCKTGVNEKVCKWNMFRLKDVIDCLEHAPTIDAVPVVRCKDCRHAVDYYHEGDCYCSNPKWGLNYFGGSWEFYCADAERRNNE